MKTTRHALITRKEVYQYQKAQAASNESLNLTALLIGDSEQNNHKRLDEALKDIGYKLTGVITMGQGKETTSVRSCIQDLSPSLIVLDMKCSVPNGRAIFDFLENIPKYRRKVIRLGKCGHHYVWKPELLLA